MLKNGLKTAVSQAKLVDILVIFFGLSTLAYLLAVRPGIEGQLDLMMYHAYNGWAGVNGVAPITEQFFHPAYTHTYFSNYIDVVMWLALDNMSAAAASNLIAFIQLIALLPLYLINTQLFKTYSKVRNFSIALLSLSSASFIMQLGNYSGDIISSIPVLFAFYWALKYVDSRSSKNIVFSALFLGLALTFKLTNIGYAALFGVFVLYVAYKKQWLHVLWFGLVSVGTFIITMIPYLMKTLEASGGRNPFFPNYNNIFKAETFPEISFTFDSVKVAPNKIGEWLQEQVGKSLEHDFRFAILVIGLLVLLVVAAFLYNKKSLNKINKTHVSILALIVAGYLIYITVFGTERYYVILTVLATPAIFMIYSIISNSFSKEASLEKAYTFFAVMLSLIIFNSTNPFVFLPYQASSYSQTFEAENLKELNKYDAVIITGPVHASWLAVVNRDYIESSGQAWLSAAFNRKDALAADGILKTRKHIGYVTNAGAEEFAGKNLATLGYTTSENCTPIDLKGKYGILNESFIACDAIYTGVYEYDIVPTDKILARNDASIPNPDNKLPFFVVPYKE